MILGWSHARWGRSTRTRVRARSLDDSWPASVEFGLGPSRNANSWGDGTPFRLHQATHVDDDLPPRRDDGDTESSCRVDTRPPWLQRIRSPRCVGLPRQGCRAVCRRRPRDGARRTTIRGANTTMPIPTARQARSNNLLPCRDSDGSDDGCHIDEKSHELAGVPRPRGIGGDPVSAIIYGVPVSGTRSAPARSPIPASPPLRQTSAGRSARSAPRIRRARLRSTRFR